MTNFEMYRKVCESEGSVTAHNFSTRILRHDSLENGDVLTIPQNVTCFTQVMQNGHGVEFVVFQNEDGDLKRVYISWFNRCTGSVADSLEESLSFEDFFKQNEGRRFRVHITKKDIENSFGMTTSKKYLFKWVK